MRLRDRVAVITGGAGAIGSAIARALARDGAAVVINYRHSEGAAHAVVDAIASAEGRATAVQGDVTDPAQAQRVIEAAVETYGRVDILVNNAGARRDALAIRMKDDDWRVVQAANLDSAFYCSRAALREMLRQRRGRIINIASIAGQVGNVGQANYAAAKAGVIGLTKALAREVGSRGITVNAVAPGFIEAGMTEDLTGEQRRAYIENVPMRRGGTPEDVAGAVAFLAGDEASYITGQVLNVDGGLVM